MHQMQTVNPAITIILQLKVIPVIAHFELLKEESVMGGGARRCN